MTTRREFIEKISHALGHNSGIPAPEKLQLKNSVHLDIFKNATPDDLMHAFADYSQSIGVTVAKCDSHTLESVLIELINSFEHETILLANDDQMKEFNLLPVLAGNGFTATFWDVEQSREQNTKQADGAKMGIAMAKCALAESGTVMVFCEHGNGRAVTLLPPTTIYLVPKSVIKPRLTQAMRIVEEHVVSGLPSSINLVSGPSATADIELVRVVGVHGPVNVVYLVITDA